MFWKCEVMPLHLRTPPYRWIRSQTRCNYTHSATDQSQNWQVVSSLVSPQTRPLSQKPWPTFVHRKTSETALGDNREGFCFGFWVLSCTRRSLSSTIMFFFSFFLTENSSIITPCYTIYRLQPCHGWLGCYQWLHQMMGRGRSVTNPRCFVYDKHHLSPRVLLAH